MSIIECPSCSSRFRVPPLENARRVRCGACGYVWPFYKEEQTITESAGEFPEPDKILPLSIEGGVMSGLTTNVTADSVPEPLFTSSRVRVIATIRRHFTPVTARSYVMLATIFVIGLFTLGILRPLITALIPRLQTAYDLVGVASPPVIYPFVFENVQARFEKGTLSLSGQVKSQMNAPHVVDSIVVTLYGPEGHVLPPETVPPIIFHTDARFIDPGQSVGFLLDRTIDQTKISAVALSFTKPDPQ